MKSIFELEIRLDMEREIEKIIHEIMEDNDAALYEEDKYHPKQYTTIIEAIDKMVFLKWKYRDTFMDVYEFLEYIGIDVEAVLYDGSTYISEEVFLMLLEFLLNMYYLMRLEDIELSKKAIAIFENIPRILEKMNYRPKELEDRIIITKRNADVDAVLENVPDNIAGLLLEYNDYRIKNDIKAKKSILKSIDLYLDDNNKKIKKQIRGIDNTLVDTFETIINNMGINHQGKEEVYTSMGDEEKIEWYDKCFLLMLHGIRAIKVSELKNERAELIKKQKN